MKIVTITLNPAFDVHCTIDNFMLYKENYATDVIKHAGGKGINISRALSGFGVENTSYCVLGRTGCDEFLDILKKDNIFCKQIILDGKIRENITFHSNAGETRVSFEGFIINKEILDKLYMMIKSENSEEMIVTFTGRIPKGITNNDTIDFLLKIKSLGAKLIVDSNSFNLNELMKIKPFLIKPNEQEISNLIGYSISNVKEAAEAAQYIYNEGIENVIVSLGSDGFVYCGSVGVLKASIPEITPVSTIGAGDSLIAGYVTGLNLGKNLIDTLKLAASFGTAACLTVGTCPPSKSNIINLENQINVNRVF